MDVLPPLADEDYACAACGLRYAPVTVEQAVGVIQRLPAAVQEAVWSVPVEARRVRPAPERWSVTEYVCHLRDVYVTYTIRLRRARTEDRPVLRTPDIV
ncbi:MAG: DinB family protein, partial [Streptosporangiaceae bacterium]